MPSPTPHSNRRLWLAYAASCLLAWVLFVLAGTELDRGLEPFWLALYDATLTLWAPSLLGVLVWPVARAVHGSGTHAGVAALVHGLGALGFALAWLTAWWAVNAGLFGLDHANAVLLAGLPWRLVAGMVVYAAMAMAFNAVLQGRSARASAIAAAQAEAALAKAELAAVTGKLNPHFLFNTLNVLIALTRKDPAGAEAALMRFSGMLRYVLDTKRDASDRVTLAEELAFLRDYLALEALRLGPRLTVDWQIEETVLDDELPPLTLQPLVENSILHGVAPRKGGGSVTVSAKRNALNQGLELVVADNGPGCDPAQLEPAAGERRGIGLSALRQRFALDYDGQARLRIRTAPGAGFRVDLWIPQT